MTVGQTTHPLPVLFIVVATQNPIEQEGAYPLPEAQTDRFLMKVLVEYPAPQDELRGPAPAARRGAGGAGAQARPERQDVGRCGRDDRHGRRLRRAP